MIKGKNTEDCLASFAGSHEVFEAHRGPGSVYSIIVYYAVIQGVAREGRAES